MNTVGAKHNAQMNVINYLPRSKGGRGLRSFEETYKITKIKLAVKIMNDKDPRMEIVKNYHNETAKTNSFSAFKDAIRYAQEVGMIIEREDEGIKINGEVASREMK